LQPQFQLVQPRQVIDKFRVTKITEAPPEA
jgi:hypothetical protein